MRRIHRPVIVLGAPRSGTTMLFETLARSSQLWSLGDESHEVLEGPYHPRLRGWESNALVAADLDPVRAAALRVAFARRAQSGRLRRAKQDRRAGGGRTGAARLRYAVVRGAEGLRRRCGTRPIRLLEKTPKNCLRIDFLRALFPDARFVVVLRDGRATIASLIDAWRAGGRYVTYEVPVRVRETSGQSWCFVLPPGWRALLDAPLEEICTAQWTACLEALTVAWPGLRGDERMYPVRYEDLVRRPRETLAPLFDFLELPFEAAVLPPAGGLPLTNVVSPPRADKWRERHGAAIARVLPRIAVLQRVLGYDDTGG